MSESDIMREISYANEAVEYIRLDQVELNKGLRIAQAQAEISFKAGIKECWDTINAHHNETFDWQSKLKEWGIDV